MKCYCYETETEFIFCVEGTDGIIYERLQTDPWWMKSGDKFLKRYPMDTGWDDAWYSIPEDKEAIINNFARLGPSWLEGVFDWEKVLLPLAQRFAQNGIEWYIIGSVSEAVLGVDIKPHDIDIAVHTRDFYRVKGLFPDNIVEPFVDNKGNWLVRYFGKLCIDGASVDIAADEKMNMENRRHRYERALWKGYELFIEPLEDRYKVEVQRGREDRIKAIEAHMSRS